jgi:cytochrome c553
VCALLVLVQPLAAGEAKAEGNAAAGRGKAATCVNCHGPAGVSTIASYPNIAGQHQEYLLKALRAYRSGERSDATMQAMVAPFSDQDLEDLAAYFASQSCR